MRMTRGPGAELALHGILLWRRGFRQQPSQPSDNRPFRPVIALP